MTWRHIAVTSLLTALAATALEAQSFDQRAQLSRAWSQMQSNRGQALLSVEGSRNTETTSRRPSDPMLLIQLGFARLATGTRTIERDDLDAAQATFDEAIYRAPKDWPWPWYGLALTDLALDSAGYTVKPSMHQQAGVYYRDAAVHALSKALDADPSFIPAAALLGDLLIPFEGTDIGAAVGSAVRHAAAAGAGPAPWLALGRVLRSKESPDSASWAFERYLTTGGDSGVGLLELARAHGVAGDSGAAIETYFRGAAVRSAMGDSAYRRDISWAASPAELATFDSVQGTAGQAAWIRAFWSKRDAEDLRQPGARLLEHFRRWRYVFQHFRLTARATGVSNAGGADCGSGAPTASPDFQLLSPGIFAATMRGRRLVDDRGIVYMRHGEPDQRVSAALERTLKAGELTPPQMETRPNESWKYVTPHGGLLFHFCASLALGTQAPTTLVAMLPLNPEMIGARSGLDPRFAALEGEIRTGHIAAEATSSIARSLVEHLIHDGEHDLRVGLTTDGFPPHFKHQLSPLAQFYAVDAPGRVLVVFTLPGEKLQGEPLPDGGIGYPVTLRLIGTNAQGQVARVDTTRRFRSSTQLGKGQYLFGLEELRLAPGTWDVRLLVTEPGTDAGGAIGRIGVTVPAVNAFALSDLVLGREGSSLTWESPAGVVPLNPLDAFPPKGSAELYYELHGATLGTTYQTDIEVTGVYGDAKGTVHLAFNETAKAALVRTWRSIGLDQLEPGQYRITVTVTEPGTRRTAVQSRLLNVAR